MPKSKRDKDVSLTKSKPKGKDAKTKLVEKIRKSVDEYERLFVISVANMRTSKLQDIRKDWKEDSRLYFGKNRVMALALGRIPEEEYKEGLSLVSKKLAGQRGLLLTNRPEADVVSYFKSLRCAEFARSGNVATQAIELTAGPLKQFSHAIEPQLRQLGLPTSLEKGVVTLLKDFTVCKEGDALTPEQARLLKLFGMHTVEFRVLPTCVWSRDDCKFRELEKRKKQA